MKNNTSLITQRFRSPHDGTIYAIEVNDDNSILWRSIQGLFGDIGEVARVHVDNRVIQYMRDDNYEDIIPLRIKAETDSIMDIVFTKKTLTTELPPKYSEDLKKISSEELLFANHISDPSHEYIRFGSRISLRHATTGVYLRSVDWNYKSGSRQHVVIGSRSSEPGPEDVWQVVPATGNTNAEEINMKKGEIIQYDTRVRLFNVANKRWLHSHNSGSPVSNQLEVTTHGSDNSTDLNDVWIVTRIEDGTMSWKTTDLFALRHETTEGHLHSHQKIYKGGNEITGLHDFYNIDNLWRAGHANA